MNGEDDVKNEDDVKDELRWDDVRVRRREA